MNINYGARIHEVCDYLETVPGERYSFYSGHRKSLKMNNTGCVVAHGVAAGIIPKYRDFNQGYAWLGFSENAATTDCFTHVCNRYVNDTDELEGEAAKLNAIKNLRAYADKKYPRTWE